MPIDPGLARPLLAQRRCGNQEGRRKRLRLALKQGIAGLWIGVVQHEVSKLMRRIYA